MMGANILYYTMLKYWIHIISLLKKRSRKKGQFISSCKRSPGIPPFSASPSPAPANNALTQDRSSGVQISN